MGHVSGGVPVEVFRAVTGLEVEVAGIRSLEPGGQETDGARAAARRAPPTSGLPAWAPPPTSPAGRGPAPGACPSVLAFSTGASRLGHPRGATAAASVVVTVPMVVLMLLFHRRIVAGLTAGAVKG